MSRCVIGSVAVNDRQRVEEWLEEVPPDIEPIDVSGPPRIGVFICHCGINIAGVVDVEQLARDSGFPLRLSMEPE